MMKLIFCKCCGEAKPEKAFRYPFSFSAKAGLANCMECYDNHLTPSQLRRDTAVERKARKKKRHRKLYPPQLDPQKEAQSGRYRLKDLERG